MTTQEFANHFIKLIRLRKPNEAYETLYDLLAESIEASGDMLVWKGPNEISARTNWWNANYELHGFEARDLSVNGDQFVLTYSVDLTPKITSNCITGSEDAMYAFKDGKIVREAFFPIV